MPETGLPKANQQQNIIRTLKIGGMTITIQKPSASISSAKKGIDNLEKAAQKKVFVTYEQQT